MTPQIHPRRPGVALACGCILGEGAVWDHRTGTLLWVDIKRPAIWQFEPATGEASCRTVAEPVGFVALTSNPEVVIGGFKSGLKRFDLVDGKVLDIASPEPDLPQNRINDGHVAPDGSIYFGTMDDGEQEDTGAFWRWDGRELSRFGGGIRVTNGPALSPDGRILYAVHTARRTILAHEVDAQGLPGPGQLLIRFEDGWGYPDGLAVDAEGHLWACHWAGSRITRFTPNGTVERTLPIPTAQVTKCAFGGPDLTTLYVTTAAIGRDPRVDPMAGHLFAVDAEVPGLPAHFARL